MLHELNALADRTLRRLISRFQILRSVEHGSVQSYLLTVVLMAFALWVRLAIAPVSAGLQYVTFFPAVTLATIVAGYRAGLLATAIGLVFATCIFTPPYYSISIAVFQTSLWSNIVFLTDGIIISVAIESLHRYRQRYAHELKISREAHAALQDSARSLQTILDNLFSYVALLDTEGVIQEVNKAPIDRGGYRRSDLIGIYFYDAPWWSHDKDVRARLIEAIEAAKQGQSRRYDVAVMMGKELVPIDFQISPVRNEAGVVIGLLPTAVEISERKRVEAELSIAAAAFESQEGIMITDANGFILKINRAFSESTGYSAEEVIGRTPRIVKSGLHDEAFYDAMWDCLNRTGSWKGEIWNRHKNGEIHPKWLTITAVKSEGGAVTHYVGAEIDITERKKAETELRLAAACFESQEAIVITDADGVILRVNPTFTEITGYTAEEVVGRNPRILKSDRHNTDFYRRMWEAINNTGKWQGEIWDRRKNGEAYPKWLTISAVKNDSGKVTHYIGVHYDITQRKQAEEKIHGLAFLDQLTGLANRFSLHERLAQALGMAQRNNRQLALMLIDLDNFKTINDTLGHPIGDQLLIQVAQRLAGSVRQSDLVARLGGDEFVVLVPEADSPMDVANVADKILTTVSAPYLIDGHDLHSSPSIGICLYPDDATEAQDLIKKADVAMYHAKANGRGNYQFFKEDIQAAAAARLAIESDLRRALEQRQFVLHYQPQLDLRSGRIVGVEALVRWQHPRRGLVSPIEFIPVAEDTGLIVPLGDWVLEEACRQLAQWRTNGLNDLRMSVNLSAKQFADPGLPLRIEKVLDRTDLPATHLDLEVTESTTMKNPADAAAMMRVLTAQKLSLSIDDFGTGYSSLAYLKQFPISTLKIDRAFVKDIETDPDDASICDVSVLLAHKLGLNVVAEGVETTGQFKYLLSIGCEKIQGYFISKPLPGDQVEQFIRNTPLLTGLGTIELWVSSSQR
jgi:diguanylate cyclase (GGDEF)-like protein/PAS domain S-box-containing protein